MSPNNGIYLLECLDGFRVAHAQAIGNLYYWEVWTCCSNPVPIMVNGDYKCSHCGDHLPKYERRDTLNPQELKEVFGQSKVYDDKESALDHADELYNDSVFVEHGIMFIKGWEDHFFPE